MLFGWWATRRSKFRYGVVLQPMWLRRVVKEAGVPMIDRFRLAQDRKRWRSIIDEAYPYKKLDADQKAELDKWVPGLPLPGILAQDT